MLTAAPLAASQNPVISQKGKIFAPGDVTISAGTTVKIANDDRVIHHAYVESKDFNFDSGEQPPGRTLDIKFTEAGTFEVLCAIHPKMKLIVKVKK